MTPRRLETKLEREAEREFGDVKYVGTVTTREFINETLELYRRGVADGKKIRDAERGDDGQ